MPVPRLPLSLVLLVALLPGNTAAAPTVAGQLHGTGTASTFQVFGAGAALEGGAADWTLACGECDVRVNLTASGFVLVQNGTATTLTPGVYEIRDFRGLVSFSRVAQYEWDFELHGNGKVGRL